MFRLPDPVPPSWEDTVPIPYAQCPACREEDRHVWGEVDAYRTGTVTLHRTVCQCDDCWGRCGARMVRVTTIGWQGHRHEWPED